MKQRKYNKALLALLVLICYVYAQFQGGFVSWFLFYSACILGIYEGLTYLLMFATLEVTREVNRQRLKEGDDVMVTLTFRRRFWFPLGWNLIVEPLPDKLSGYFEPHQQVIFPGFKREQVIHYLIPAIPRGHYQMKECILIGGDFFGFLHRQKKIELFNDFLVYPSYKQISHWSAGDGRISGNVHVAHLRSDDVAAVRGVREYQRGDRLSQIHWRASARGHGLKTKEFEHQAMNQLIFFLDVQKPASTQIHHHIFETSVKLTASLIYYSSINMHSYGFVARGKERIVIPPAISQQHFFRVFDQLARVHSDGEDSFARVIGREAMEFPKGYTLVMITSALTKDLVLQVGNLARSGRNIQVFWVHDHVIPTVEENEALKRLRSVKVMCTPVHVDAYEELKQIGGA